MRGAIAVVGSRVFLVSSQQRFHPGILRDCGRKSLVSKEFRGWGPVEVTVQWSAVKCSGVFCVELCRVALFFADPLGTLWVPQAGTLRVSGP